MYIVLIEMNFLFTTLLLFVKVAAKWENLLDIQQLHLMRFKWPSPGKTSVQDEYIHICQIEPQS